MQFQDEGYIVHIRKHGESGVILTLVSRLHGKVTGYVRGALGKRKLSIFQLGNLVDFEAYSRVDNNMLTLRVELKTPFAVRFLGDANKLQALTSFCASWCGAPKVWSAFR